MPTIVTTSYAAAVIDQLVTALGALPEIEAALARLLNPTDPNASVGITCSEWLPIDYSMGQFEPVLSGYFFQIEALTKNTNAADGEMAHYALAQAVRNCLYRDEALRAALSGLVVGTERAYSWSLASQRFANNVVRGEFTFLSVTTLTFQTEIAC